MSVPMVKRQHRARQDPLSKFHRPGDECITEGWVASLACEGRSGASGDKNHVSCCLG